MLGPTINSFSNFLPPSQLQHLPLQAYSYGPLYTSYKSVKSSHLWNYNPIEIAIHNWLVVLTILKNMKVNGKDDIPYIMENKIHVPNHQPAIYGLMTMGQSSFWSWHCFGDQPLVPRLCSARVHWLPDIGAVGQHLKWSYSMWYLHLATVHFVCRHLYTVIPNKHVY